MSSFWRRVFGVQYRILAWLDPLIRAVWRRAGIGNVLELVVTRRDGRGDRTRLIGLLHAAGGSYIGHPNGDAAWTRDLAAAGGGTLRYPAGTEWDFRATVLPKGAERDAAIDATGQHPFPGNLVYYLGRRHVRAVGVFFRLESA